VLEVERLSKSYPIRSGVLTAVDGVSFTIGKGETLGLVGESGCGKTTVGKTVLKLQEPTAGVIRLNGEDITHLNTRQMRPYRRKMQIIFQDPFSSLNPRMRAGHVVGEPMTVHGIASGSEWRDRVVALFERVGLRPDQMRRYPHEFSGGQRQRLAIARALSVNPELIIADESVSALDVSIQASVINLLMDLQRDYGLSFLFIAHDIAVVEHISHRIAVMYLGKIVEIGDRSAILTAPQHPYTQALLSAVPVPDPKARNKARMVLKGETPSPVNRPSGCKFHPRCPFAVERCRMEEPVLREVRAGHAAACHLR